MRGLIAIWSIKRFAYLRACARRIQSSNVHWHDLQLASARSFATDALVGVLRPLLPMVLRGRRGEQRKPALCLCGCCDLLRLVAS